MEQEPVNLLLVGGAAEYLGVSRQRIYGYISEGTLRVAGKNSYGQNLFAVADLEEVKKALHARRFSIAKPA